MTDPAPQTDDDDALADALADAWVESAATDPRLRLLARRAAGLAKEPSQMTVDELARTHGTNRNDLNRAARRALAKLRLSPEILSLKSHA